ncbi:MAG: hypothetical protein CMI53_04810 [Parcubacteria group bacterium]|nr:hypothetical protein [Parcubacteria group bacterium]|tara:strand:+ start:4292 stop:5695 length:1404 start_codon:yes stop_codon:yes gene_type:complete
MKRSELLFTAAKPPLDYLALVFAAITAFFIRYLPSVQSIRPVIFNLSFKEYFGIALIISAVWIIIFILAGLYTIGGVKKIRDELGKIFVACTAGLATVLGIMVFSRFLFDSRFIIITAWVLAIIFVSFERLIIQLTQRLAYRAGIGTHRIIIIGNGQIANELIKEFTTRFSLGYRVVDKFSQFDSMTAEKIKHLAKIDAVDEIIQINPNLEAKQTSELIDLVNEYHLDFKYTADLLGTQLTNLEVTTYAGLPVVEVKKTRLDGWGKIYKRSFDIIGSIMFIVLLSPIMLIIALAIKLDSKGPIFFKYKRIGEYGKAFDYLKFRSMIPDTHKYRFDKEFLSNQENLRQGSPMMKFKGDPRITKVGKFIRRFSLDELPELFIVLFGKMSLVGPRPHEVEEVEKYQKHHKKLLTIKPGMTGMSQVSGRSDLDFEQEVKLDTFYIENWSVGLDLHILIKTPLAILKRRRTQ